MADSIESKAVDGQDGEEDEADKQVTRTSSDETNIENKDDEDGISKSCTKEEEEDEGNRSGPSEVESKAEQVERDPLKEESLVDEEEEEEEILIAPDIQLEEIGSDREDDDEEQEEMMDCLPPPEDDSVAKVDEEEETKNSESGPGSRIEDDDVDGESKEEEENDKKIESVSAECSGNMLIDTELISSDDDCLNLDEDIGSEKLSETRDEKCRSEKQKEDVSLRDTSCSAGDVTVDDEMEDVTKKTPVSNDVVVLECKADVVDCGPSEDAGIKRDAASEEDVGSSNDDLVADGIKESVKIMVIEKVDDENENVEETDKNSPKNRTTTDDLCIGVDEGDDLEDTVDDTDMPRFSIMDVRTVVEEEKTSVADKSVEGQGDTVDVDEHLDSAQIPSKEAKESSEEEKEKEKMADAKSNEIYAAETMNEILGRFGCENVDDNVKDSLQLSTKESSEETGDCVVEKDDVDVAKSSSLASSSKIDGKTVVVGGKPSTPSKDCSVCGKTRSCKYQVLMLGMTKFLCDDTCFTEFRTKQNIMSTPTIKQIVAENRPVTRSITHPKDFCNVCHKEIKNGMGLLPGVGENKPLCSEECMRYYQATQGLKRACAQCGGHILSRTKCLTWEAMEFCNEECLGKYQSYLGSHCAFCNNSVQQTSLGKYCVRFGSDIKQFCSNTCLEEFKKGLKVCSYCQKDISSGTEGFLAPVGEKGQFKEFCTQSCMEKYETMGNPTISQPSIQKCSVCNKLTAVKVEVTFDGKVNKLCSESCIAAFRYANKINTSICDTCHKFFDLDVSRQLSIQIEGSCKRFCTKACMNVFVLHHRKVVPCSWCKVKKYNFDMIERVDSNNHVQLFCSLNCLSLFRVSLNATSSRRIQCDYCHQMKPAQYHLTMSDASIRNFCSYPCVMQFQSQFTAVAPVVSPQSLPAAAVSAPAKPPASQTTNQTSTAVTTQSGTPIISSVMSLAPAQTQAQVAGTSKPLIVRQQVLSKVVAKNLKTAQTQTLHPAITQHVVIKQPVAKMLKNKTILCKPTVQTKGVSCKPHPCHKTTQTDEDYKKQVIIPIPVPIYVPVPMHMYTTPVPFPLPFPIPIPVPIFIPTTKNSAQGIFKQIKEIQEKIPDNPFEADLILMAEMVAEDNPSKDKSRKVGVVSSNKSSTGGDLDLHPTSNREESGSPEATNENFNDMDTELQDSCQTTNSFGEEVLQMALRMASGMDEPVDLEAALSGGGGAESNSRDSLSIPDENGSYLSARDIRAQTRCHKRTGGRGRGRGRKRARMDESRSPPSTPPTQLPQPPPPYSYGVNAWKHWVLQKNTQLEKASQTNRKLKLFKTDILQLTADELNYSLCLFVKEVRKPNGEEYASDSIYYLCLGIQQYLFENGRIDNIFADTYYEKFTECLNDVLVRYEATVTREGVFLSRIEEEILWDCKQLGAHSPHVLLNTLMYFNTKYFMLKTVDEHTQLSFSHILKHWKKGPGGSGGGAGGGGKVTSGTPGRSALLRYYPPSQMKDTSRRRKEVIPSYEQVENLDNPLRCPVKLYEFYLSKCPESIKNRNDVFYLYPERSCVPDSPVWYSTLSLGKETITKMLQRIKMVREVGENMMLP